MAENSDFNFFLFFVVVFFLKRRKNGVSFGLMLEEAKIVSFDVGLRVYIAHAQERERERDRFRERKIQRETARKREEEERLVFRSGLCKKKVG